MRIFFIFYFLISLFSCAGIHALEKKGTDLPAKKKGRATTTHEELIDSLEKSHHHHHHHFEKRINGSATLNKQHLIKGKAYFLYGAEHLKLQTYYFDIPVVYNASVKKWINYFLNKGKDFFLRYTQRSGRYGPIMGKILEDHGLPRDFIFLAMVESGFNNKAKSWARAVGPWQFMPFTGKKYGLKINSFIDERRDPIKATIAASRYLKFLKNLFGSWELAAAGYNAGEGKVGRAIKRYSTENFWKLRKGRYLKRETKNYVPKIMAMAILGKNLSSFGLQDVEFYEPLDFDEITIPGNTDLIDLSEALDVSFTEIQRLNPEILRWHTDPFKEKYILRVPVGYKKEWDRCCIQRDFPAYKFQTYTVKRRRSLKNIASRMRISVRALQELNPKISAKSRLKNGSTVKLPFRIDHNRKEPMYADLYGKRRGRKSLSFRRRYLAQIRRAKRYGKKIINPRMYYIVKRGDTLWGVSKKLGVPVYTIIRSNLALLSNGRMIRAGDKLIVR